MLKAAKKLLSSLENRVDPFRHTAATTPPRSVAKFYAHYIKQAKVEFFILLLFGLGAAIIEVALFDFLGRIVDMVQQSAGADFFQLHWRELLFMALVTLVLRPVIFALHDLFLYQTIGPSLTSLIRWQSHRHLLRQSYAFFTNDFAGRIANRVMQTGTSLRMSALDAVDGLWHALIYIGSALLLFTEADWRLTLPLLVWLVAYSAVLYYYVPIIKQRSAASSHASSQLMGRVVDGYTNIATLKLFAHPANEERYVREAVQVHTNAARKAGRAITSLDFIVTAINGALIVATAALSLWLWKQGSITVGAITLATGLVIRINNMSGWIMWVVNSIFENIGVVEDGMKTISQPLTVVDKEQATELQIDQGEISFDAIHFHYGQSTDIIKDFSLHIKAGERIGLIGPSGAGKSTLVNLLLRLYDLEQGVIRIDGQDISTVTQESLRSAIGVVTQDTSLLHRTIRENVLYGRPGASESQLMDAIRKARADHFIHQLRDNEGNRGLDCKVGERGVKLSGGQRQRIAIARILLKNAPILVLDEATSALDSETEIAIQESLDLLMEGKTVIAIAHRLSTIARMDRLVVMDKGRLIESGTHEELLRLDGLYARLWNHQTGGFVGET